MLSRTASNLYWLSRYVERAECLARILDATYRLSALPQGYGSQTNEWESALATAGSATAFGENYEEANERNVTEWLAFSPENPASIRNCMEIARANARSVRTALTGQMWDAINSAWHELHRYDPKRITREEFTRFLNFVTEASVRFDGTSFRTMLRNDAYWFSRLGFLVERADATARILDVKYHVLLPREAQVGGPLDYFQWASILRSVSAHRSYRWVYKDHYRPWNIAEYLILNRQMPRSLRACYDELMTALNDLSAYYGQRHVCHTTVAATRDTLMEGNIKTIFQSGLHEFVEEFISRNNRLGADISAAYHFNA